MKILQCVLSAGFYGSERYCIDLATAQARIGHNVTVLIDDDHSHCASQYRRAIEGAKTSKATGSIELLAIPRMAPRLLHRLIAKRVLARVRPDIVHTHLNPAARRVGAVAQQLGIPHVSTLHLHFEQREHDACDGLILVNEFQRALLPADFKGEVTVAWTALPAAHLKALNEVTHDEIAALRRQWQADDTTVVFGTIGRLVHAKGLDRLILTFRSVFPRGDEPVRLVILGEGTEEGMLHELASGDERIRFLRTQKEVAPFYRAFDVYTNTARFEPFGLTVLEAMAAGCSLVLTRTDGPGHYASGQHVLISEQDDDAALRANLSLAANWPRQRYSYDTSTFSQERIVGIVQNFYQKVINKRRPQLSRNSEP
jgi:glycosyltransferase involved in cell wall biosynthesis